LAGGNRGGYAFLRKQEDIENVSLAITRQSRLFRFKTAIGAASGLTQCQTGWWFENGPH